MKLKQLIGLEGSGTRRLALEFIQPARTIAWISPRWKLWAPLLWALANDRALQLIGIECSERKRLRSLWRTLVETQSFDGLILDHFKLTQGEGAFLEQLTRKKNIQVLVLDERAHVFCQERAYVQVHHHHYKVLWPKELKSKEYPHPTLEFFKNNYSALKEESNVRSE